MNRMWNMSDAPIDPWWPKMLSLTAHEVRSPLTVVSGYLSMLLKSNRFGPLTEQQRHLLEESQKSSGKIASLLNELSDLSKLQAKIEMGENLVKPKTADLHSLLRTAVEQLPPPLDRPIEIDLQLGSRPAPIGADPALLTEAFKWILGALRREVVTSDRLIVRERHITHNRTPVYELQIGDEETLAVLEAEGADGRVVFCEWRGGNVFVLTRARRIIDAHGGRIWGPPDNPPNEAGRIVRRKAGARVVLPRASRKRPAKRVV